MVIVWMSFISKQNGGRHWQMTFIQGGLGFTEQH
jgi:hypothetical protein